MPLMLRSKSKSLPASPDAASQTTVLAVRKHLQVPQYLGALSEASVEQTKAPPAYKKEFQLSASDRALVAAGTMHIGNSVAFEQAHNWLHAGDKPEASQPPPKERKAGTSIPPGEHEQWVTRLIDYNTTLGRRPKSKPDDLYLVYDFGTHKMPPHGGFPQIFRSWSGAHGSSETEGAQYHVERHSKCLYKKFGSVKPTSAAAWIADFSQHDILYRQRWGDRAPVWHTKPLDYDEYEHNMFKIADSTSLSAPPNLGQGGVDQKEPSSADTLIREPPLTVLEVKVKTEPG